MTPSRLGTGLFLGFMAPWSGMILILPNFIRRKRLGAGEGYFNVFNY